MVAGRKGLSFDEGEELAVGYSIWRQHDFRMEGANGDLIKRWATLPFLLSRPALPRADDRFWRGGWPYEFGFEFCFKQGNDLDSLLRQSRSMVILLGLATAVMIFVISRAIFGDIGGLVSLGLFVCSPHMLAFGAIVSTEMSLCLTLLGSTWCVWRLLHGVTWGRIAASLAFVALLVLAKPTAVVILPITVVLIAARLLSSRPLKWCLGRRRDIASKWAQVGVFSGFILAHALVGWGAIWTHYEFRYRASSNPADSGIVFAQLPHPDPIDPRVSAFIDWSRRHHFLPEGFLHGVKWLLRHNDDRIAFLDGQWKIGGWRKFFLRAAWLKTSPVLLALVGLGLVGWAWASRRRDPPLAPAPLPGSPLSVPSLYEAIPWITLTAVVFGAAIPQNLNIGYRHILPIYPPLFVLAGASAIFWQKRLRILVATQMALLLWFAADSISVYPHYLSYFNPLAGGSSEGYKHLVDSSIDWGMNLPDLKRWLDQHNPSGREPVFLAYFGYDSPTYRHIVCRELPGFPDWSPTQAPYDLTPGFYAISATLLQSVYTDPLGPWSTIYENDYQTYLKYFAVYHAVARDPQRRSELAERYPPAALDLAYRSLEHLRFGRLCAWLRHRGKPVDSIGYGILIWRLTATDIQEALYGPPAEIDDTLIPQLKR